MYTIILTFQCSDTGNRKDTWSVEILLQLSPKITLWVTQPNLKSSHKSLLKKKWLKLKTVVPQPLPQFNIRSSNNTVHWRRSRQFERVQYCQETGLLTAQEHWHRKQESYDIQQHVLVYMTTDQLFSSNIIHVAISTTTVADCRKWWLGSQNLHEIHKINQILLVGNCIARPRRTRCEVHMETTH